MTPDLPLARRVSNVLAKTPHLQRRMVKCETHEGRVVLRGTVGSYYQKQMAQEALRSLEGVAEIENQLEVCWSQPA